MTGLATRKTPLTRGRKANVLPEADLITSIKHPAILAARNALRAPGDRAAECFLADGEKFVRQALDAGAAVEAIFLLQGADPADVADLAALANVPCFPTTKGVFFKLLDLGYQTSVTMLAVVRRPPPPTLPAALGDDFCILLGERIQDPRNIGVLLRTADGLGPASVAFSAVSADPYARAAVRSSTGSIFRITPALPVDLPAYARRLKTLGARILGTSAAANPPCWAATLTGPLAIVVGNETNGMTDALSHECDERVTIPMAGGAHSFNVTVAAGVLLYERARQAGRPD